MSYDVIIIGMGPAGLSASLYTARGNLKTLIIGRQSALTQSKLIENYCCTKAVSGEELIKNGIEQAKGFGVQIAEEEVLDLVPLEDGTFQITTDQNKYSSKAVIIATGKVRESIRIKNLEKFEGMGVHYCVTCDGFFYKNMKVGVLGYKDYAVHELSELEGITSDITLYTNGNELQINDKSRKYLDENNIPIRTEAIESLEGGDSLEKIIFKNGQEEDINGLFVAYGSASSLNFAQKLGILLEKDSIIVDKEQKTNVPGIFAAGDCTGGLAQVATAVGQGAVAGQSAKNYVKNIKSKGVNV